MSDSVKLRYEHAMWCLFFAFIVFAGFIVCCFLCALISPVILYALIPLGFVFLLLMAAFLDYLAEAIRISSKKSKKNGTGEHEFDKNPITFKED